MPLISFQELMNDAQRGCYAVGYFETWNLDSLMAVADAAENLKSPVVLGLSGDDVARLSKGGSDCFANYAAICLDVCRRLTVPVCLMLSDSAQLNLVHSALELGFNLVSFRDRRLANDLHLQIMRGLTGWAHHIGAAVEAELQPMAGSGLSTDEATRSEMEMTVPQQAQEFIRQTGVDALVVNIRQRRRNRSMARLDLRRLAELSQLQVPLVLDEPALIDRTDLSSAVEKGIRKVNVGPVLKQVYRQASSGACAVRASDNPVDVADSGREHGTFPAARAAIQRSVEDFMQLFGSAGKAFKDERSDKSSPRAASNRVLSETNDLVLATAEGQIKGVRTH